MNHPQNPNHRSSYAPPQWPNQQPTYPQQQLPSAQPAYGPAYGQPVHAPQSPAAANDPPGGSGGLWVRWVMLGGFIGGPLCWVLITIIGSIVGGDDQSGVASGIAFLLMGAAWLFLAAFVASIYVWIYKSWEMLPERARFTGSGKQVSPGAAVGMMFIPGFSAYWMFVVSVGYANALNRVLASVGSAKRAPANLALMAAICTLIPFVNLLAPLLWIGFALLTDAAKADYLARTTQPASPPRAQMPVQMGYAPGYGG